MLSANWSLLDHLEGAVKSFSCFWRLSVVSRFFPIAPKRKVRAYLQGMTWILKEFLLSANWSPLDHLECAVKSFSCFEDFQLLVDSSLQHLKGKYERIYKLRHGFLKIFLLSTNWSLLDHSEGAVKSFSCFWRHSVVSRFSPIAPKRKVWAYLQDKTWILKEFSLSANWSPLDHLEGAVKSFSC